MKKHLLIALLVAVALTSCNKTEKFNVNISLMNTDENTMIYLRKIVDNRTVVIDSAVFKNETAVLIAPFDDPQMLYSIKVKGMRGSMEFFPENQDITVVGDIENPHDVEILGGEAQTLYTEYRKGYEAFTDQISELYARMEEAYNNGDTVALQAINEEGTELMSQQRDYFVNFVNDHNGHFVAHYLLDGMRQDYPLDELKNMVANLEGESLYINNLNNYIEKQEQLEVGHPCIDFTLKTADDEEVVLSEYVKQNKLTLIDFWASWCGPCRGENPHVLAAYNQYHEQGFNVLGISVDQDADAWQQAVEADGLVWTQVRDAEQKASEAYMIYYIPSNFLINTEGIIVAKGLRGDDLEKAILENL